MPLGIFEKSFHWRRLCTKEEKGLLEKLPCIPALLKAEIGQELHGDNCSPEVVNIWVWDIHNLV